MINNMVQNYQIRVIGADENIDYSSAIIQSYPLSSIQTEPYFGFKVLMRDMNANIAGSPKNRLDQIDQYLYQTGAFIGKGCILRETSASMPDGLWLITFPVPKQHLKAQFNKLMNAITILQRDLGIIRVGLWELNVSGRCGFAETEYALNNLMIPEEYMKEYFVKPKNSAYSYGEVVRINSQFMVLRTRWALLPNKEVAYFDTNPRPGMYNLQSIIMTLCLLIASIYH